MQEIREKKEMHKTQSTTQAQTRKRKCAIGIEEIYADKEIYLDKENVAGEEICAEEGICAKDVTCMEKGNCVEGRRLQGKTVAQV